MYNVVSGDVTITSSLRTDVIIFGRNFLVFRMVCAKNDETACTFVEVMQTKTVVSFSGHGIYHFDKSV